ncbi:MAG TPA: hypothetical protein PK637_14205 [Flavobacteriales bacterium]|nr:hypothetical protein [Flavobacteriales bacterium]HRE97918.1 hypothetical protein [Flavobacteriales bacterium]
METINYELNLKEITKSEYFLQKETYDQYKTEATFYLNSLKKYIPEGSTLDEHNGKTIEEMAIERPARYLSPGMVKQNGKNVRVWCDLLEDFIITPEHKIMYGRFMAYFLRNLSLQYVDEFLEYHLVNYYNHDEKKFTRFLKLNIREQTDGTISNETIETVNEWIDEKKKQENLPAKIKTKGKPKRQAGDKATELSQEQTTVLIHYLKEAKIIHRGEYLTNKEAGEAFSILTGYSADTIRQTLGKQELDKICTPENLTAVQKSLQQAINFIHRKNQEKK